MKIKHFSVFVALGPPALWSQDENLPLHIQNLRVKPGVEYANIAYTLTTHHSLNCRSLNTSAGRLEYQNHFHILN